MSAQPIFIGDVGTVFRLTIQEDVNTVTSPIDISTQTAMSFIFVKPDGSSFTRTPVFTNTGEDGQIEYVILTGELDQAGTWQLQAEVTLPTGGPFRTEIIKFIVQEKLT